MNDHKNPFSWKCTSPDEEGLHTVVSPENSACRTTWIFRLNLSKGGRHRLQNDTLELNGAVISGKAKISCNGRSHLLNARDSFYIPARQALEIEALADLAVFIGGGPYEGKGRFFVRSYDLSLPLGTIHQVHGRPPFQREVFMTIAQEDEGSRLICGITEGQPGMWTSWPPHQHSKDLEEVYCYFDIPAPKFALHLSSRLPGKVEAIHSVSTGDCVIVPEGYHPTVGMPGVKSCYFWVMAAHRPESRRYDLAVNDCNYED
jgi:5-deoxy-glucuronate isomerase